MADILNIEALEQLKPFLNNDGVLEIALRGKNKKFAAFQKIVLGNSSTGESKELIQNAINNMNKANAINNENIALLGNIANLQQLSLLMGGINLCATAAGFAIMNAKLDKISGQINKLMYDVKQGNEVKANYEFKKVISDHSDMLDCRKKQKYYTEEQMRELVDKEYNVLELLLDIFLKDLAVDQENLIFSMYSLASMLAVSIRYFDELYYFNNKEAIGDGDVWHSSHNTWISIFDRLSSDEVVKRIQDHGIFDLNLNTVENDIYYISLRDQILGLKEDIEDNQTLITTFDNMDILSNYTKYMEKDISDSIKTAFEQTDGCLDNDDVNKIYHDAMKQMALAI